MQSDTESPRKRTFYDPEADYTRPLYELPQEKRERMCNRLRFLYGDKLAEEYMPELERILKVHHAHKPPEMMEKERNYDPRERFSQQDMILITYGDMVKGPGATPLSALHNFINTYNPGALIPDLQPTGVHRSHKSPPGAVIPDVGVRDVPHRPSEA